MVLLDQCQPRLQVQILPTLLAHSRGSKQMMDRNITHSSKSLSSWKCLKRSLTIMSWAEPSSSWSRARGIFADSGCASGSRYCPRCSRDRKHQCTPHRWLSRGDWTSCSDWPGRPSSKHWGWSLICRPCKPSLSCTPDKHPFPYLVINTVKGNLLRMSQRAYILMGPKKAIFVVKCRRH